MSIKNFLNLRAKRNLKVVVVEKEVIEAKSILYKTVQITAIIIFVATSIWGISKADNIIENKQVTDKGFSAIGIVSNITETEISIVDAKGTNKDQDSYTLSTLSVNKIETKDYQPLTLSDIKIGDRVITQGKQTDDGDIIIGRIISFGFANLPKEETATTTATNTESSSTTEETSETNDSSSSGIIQTIKDVITDTISDIVDTITGTSSTGTTTEEATSSTDETATEPTATTTDTTPEATDTEETPTPPAPAEQTPVPTPEPEPMSTETTEPVEQQTQDAQTEPTPTITEPTN